MASYPMVLGVSLVGILAFSVIVFMITGSVMAVFVVFMLAAVIFYLLNLYGYISVSSSGSELDVSFHEKAPAPVKSKSVTPVPSMPIEKTEVFYVSGNNYTYDEAAAVCAAYDADLASYDQVMGAYSAGAEWCGYGWTLGGMALFPTQQSTWETLQQEVDISKRTACGRPGINGGYFDPNTKFGVNCYGVKPKDKGTEKYPLPVPGTDTNQFNQMVNKFKSMINKMTVSPFNRSGWSEWNLSAHK